MKIIKRDGRIVEYDRDKIFTAISKANRDVREPERASNKQIETIIKHIEELNKKRMLVEDIQDFIETDLMKIKKYALAKSYIIYRYTRALVRKNNNTDESILSIIKNGNTNNDYQTNNQNIVTNRNLIASEVSKNLSKRILLPEKTVIEHENGFIYFHDLEYFLEPFINTSTINFIDILDNESITNKPSNLRDACLTLSEIINITSSNQINEVNINLTKIVKYYKPKDNIKESINILFQQLSTLINIKGTLPKANFYLKIEKGYEELSIKLIQEIINKYQNNYQNINLYYELNEDNYINQKYYYLTKEIMKYNIFIVNKKLLQDNYFQENTFNEGKVSLNLVRIALNSNDEEEFYKILDDKLEIIKEALLSKYHSLLGTISNTSPILWQTGALAKLNKFDKIDKLLKNNSTLSIGFLGLYEVNKIMKKDDFSLKIIKYIKKTCDNWKKETNLNFNLVSIYNKEISSYFLKSDLDKFGLIKDITDKEYYHLSYEMDYKNIEEQLIMENKYQNITKSYSIIKKNDDIENILELIYNNIQVVKIKGE